MKTSILISLTLYLMVSTSPVRSQEKKASPANLPVKEITVFKDGHAFVVQEGALPTDSRGNIILDALPTPVIGTFWPYTYQKNASLKGVVASQEKVAIERSALGLRELIEANLNQEAIINEGTNRYDAVILGFTERSAEELKATLPSGSPDPLPIKGNILLLKTAEGTKALPVEKIQDLVFKKSPGRTFRQEEFRNLLTLQLDWKTTKPEAKAGVGFFYLQKGFRWIPSYKISIDGSGKAVVQLQATLLNELGDLDNTTVNLVIGVPSFLFKETLDPMALQQTLAHLSHYFQNSPDPNSRRNALASNFSNAMMTQVARMGDYQSSSTGGGTEGTIPEGAANEDLFVFTLKNITLKKGQRMVVNLGESTLTYRDLYQLEVPLAPPSEMQQPQYRLNPQNEELARLFQNPTVMHKIRLKNLGASPLTTAPALILHQGKVLAQTMMTYTAPGASTDLTLTTAVDVQVTKKDSEKDRVNNALKHNGSFFTRVNLSGEINVINHKSEPIELEVIRYVFGNVDQAGQNGKVEKVNLLENANLLRNGSPYQSWNYYNWPNWWNLFNGVGKVQWNPTVKPGESFKVTYDWHYFWQ